MFFVAEGMLAISRGIMTNYLLNACFMVQVARTQRSTVVCSLWSAHMQA
jgi:hypothetical protein